MATCGLWQRRKGGGAGGQNPANGPGPAPRSNALLLQPIPPLAARGCKEEGQLGPTDHCVPGPASTDVQEYMPGPEHPYGKTQR